MTEPATTIDATAKKSISLPSDLLESAIARAKSEHRTLSSYIQMLISKDLKSAAQEPSTETSH